MSEAVLGVILAGGLARRMGGGDKALKTVGDRTILDRVVERLRPQCGRLIINANGDPDRFSGFGLPVVPDNVPDFAGPLAGILAALDHAAAAGPDADLVVSVAADTPFLPRDLVARLLRERDAAGAELACAGSDGRTHPVVGLWPVRIREELRRALTQEGERKIDRFTARFRMAVVEWPTVPLDPFFNANRPADLEEAEALLSRLAD
jgi:molybdopterin-guanine dinucleotide biosynthesis protein A